MKQDCTVQNKYDLGNFFWYNSFWPVNSLAYSACPWLLYNFRDILKYSVDIFEVSGRNIFYFSILEISGWSYPIAWRINQNISQLHVIF